MKIYARQIAPDQQLSPFYTGDHSDYTGIYIFGNKRLFGLNSEEAAAILRKVDLFSDTFELLQSGGLPGSKFSEILTYYFPGDYCRKDRLQWINLLKNYIVYSDEKTLCAVLNLQTGKEWDYETICGYCQSDWNICVYSTDEWTPEAIERITAEYFNTGTEWIIHDGETAPKCPEDVSGYSVYCTGWNNDKIREEIANVAGGKPKDVILFEFREYERRAVYDMV